MLRKCRERRRGVGVKNKFKLMEIFVGSENVRNLFTLSSPLIFWFGSCKKINKLETKRFCFMVLIVAKEKVGRYLFG